MEWVKRLNEIKNRAEETVLDHDIYVQTSIISRKDCFKLKTLDEYKTEQMKNTEFVKEYDLIQPELKKIREEINQNIIQESKIIIEK